jgi:hypothetical protein
MPTPPTKDLTTQEAADLAAQEIRTEDEVPSDLKPGESRGYGGSGSRTESAMTLYRRRNRGGRYGGCI